MKAITIGSAMADIIALIGDSDVERMTMHNATSSFLLLEQGKKIEARSIGNHIGGGAINMAVSLSRLGVETSTLVKVGRDADGADILDRLAAEGISTGQVLYTDELPTGTAVMVSSHDKNPTIFTQRGANTLLEPKDVRPSLFDGLNLVCVASLSNRSADCFPKILELASGSGAYVSANPGIRQLTSRSVPFLGSLEYLDLLAINRIEAEALVPAISANTEIADAADAVDDDPDLPRLLKIGLESVGFTMSLGTFFRAVQSLGVKNVVLTDGAEGSYLATADHLYFCPARPVRLMGTAGAGDAFISTLCRYLADGKDCGAAMQAATLNAGSVIEYIDTQEGLLSAPALDEHVAQYGSEIPVRTISRH